MARLATIIEQPLSLLMLANSLSKLACQGTPPKDSGPWGLSSDIYVTINMSAIVQISHSDLSHFQTLNLCLSHLFFSLANGIATRSRNTEFLTVNSFKLGMEAQSY